MPALDREQLKLDLSEPEEKNPCKELADVYAEFARAYGDTVTIRTAQLRPTYPYAHGGLAFAQYARQAVPRAEVERRFAVPLPPVLDDAPLQFTVPPARPTFNWNPMIRPGGTISIRTGRQPDNPNHEADLTPYVTTHTIQTSRRIPNT